MLADTLIMISYAGDEKYNITLTFNEEYLPAYEDKNSEEFKTLSNKIINEVS